MTAAKSHQQNMNRVQSQALRIITGAMRSTPIKNGGHYEHSSPQCQKRVQGIAAGQQVQVLKTPPHEHQGTTTLLRTAETSSFRKETRALVTKHQEKLPAQEESLPPPEGPPWENGA